MKAITLRNVPKHLAKLIRRKADQEGISLAKAVTGLLEDRAGKNKAKKRQRRYHDLDRLAASWSKPEAAAFDRALTNQRVVDEKGPK